MTVFLFHVFFYLTLVAMGMVLVKRTFAAPLVDREYDWEKTSAAYMGISCIPIVPGCFAFMSTNPVPIFLMAVAYPLMFREIYTNNGVGYESVEVHKTYGRIIGCIGVLGTLSYAYYQAEPMSLAFILSTTFACVWTISILNGLFKPKLSILKSSRSMANIRLATCRPSNRKAFAKELDKKRRAVNK